MFREELNANGISPQYTLGQNFLWDEESLRNIILDTAVFPMENILEIGSGVGTLSRVLADLAQKVISIEIDPNLQEYLISKHQDSSSLHFLFGDALKYHLGELFSEDELENVQVVANLPYYITSELITHCLTTLPRARRMTFLVQRDAVPRLQGVAGDGKSKSKNQGWLSKLISCYGEVKLSRKMSAEAFYPKPHVDSQFIYFERLESAALTMLEEHPQELLKTIQLCFGQRRKTVLHLLTNAGFREITQRWLEEMQYSSTIRAEQLKADDFAQLAKRLYLEK